ncbi:hypothetical protein K440DRAFT_656957 [Wilcoxina mikolae CBS 423.85]|nr:hypothetical protein K440DRAFT_656957 [Wilcoxina mikolae CBS 423.85]
MLLPVPLLLPILFTITAAADTYRVVSNNEEFVADSVLPLKPHKAVTPVKIKPRSTNPRDIFARAICYAPNTYCGSGCCPPETPWCCWNTSCMDKAVSKCCVGGSQCKAGEDCCDNGCCAVGSYCVQNLRTFVYSCYSGTSNQDDTTTRTRITFTPTATRTLEVPTPSQTCDNAGYDLCPDTRYCCPRGNYCFYDTAGAPRCWDGSAYYTYWWYYSWSYSFGMRWYRSTSSIYLADYTATVPVLTTATPDTAPDTANAVPSPTTTRRQTTDFSAATGSALPAGSPVTQEDLPQETVSSSSRVATAGSTGLTSGSFSAAGKTEVPWRLVIGIVAGVVAAAV